VPLAACPVCALPARRRGERASPGEAGHAHAAARAVRRGHDKRKPQFPAAFCIVEPGAGEFCGSESHEYELYLAVEDIDYTRTKAKSPQTDGICERFHRTVLDEFYRVAFRKKIYRTTDELQDDLDAWIVEYNELRPHQGRWCFGKTPMQTFLDALPLAKEKLMAA